MSKMKTKKNKMKTKKNKKTRTYKTNSRMKFPPIAFYKNAPTTTIIGGFPFLLLPLDSIVLSIS